MKSLFASLLLASTAAVAQEPAPRLLQQPAISRDWIAFVNAGDLWIVPRAGGAAVRLTTGVGVESGPIFSPDGRTIAFTGDYDGNIDVYTIPVTGGVPYRVTYHPGPDVALGWSPDGKRILFRSQRAASSRYSQIFQVDTRGGFALPLPLPMAASGQLSPDGATIAYNPLPPAFSFDFTSYVAWGNYKGGRAGTIWLTTLPGLQSTQVPHTEAADFSPVWAGGKLYFLSGRNGPISIFSYDPVSRAVAEVFHNPGPSDIRSLATDGATLIFDRLGELFTLVPGEAPRRLGVTVEADMPDVRARILPVADQVENIRISPTGLRAVVEAHGEILTVPAKEGVIRNITNSSGAMEREPAWSPDGQSIAYFSDADGLYSLKIAPQTGGGPARTFKLASEPAYYFHPIWSPDSKKLAFRDNRLNVWVLDTVSGQLRAAGAPDVYGGFAAVGEGMAWSPDSAWLAFPRTVENHLQVLMLHSVATGRTIPLTDNMASVSSPAFDRSGKYLYFFASNDAGPNRFGLDMSTDLYNPTSSLYALALSAATKAPDAPELNDEKSAAQAQNAAADQADTTPAGQAGEAASVARKAPGAQPKAVPSPKAVAIDLIDLPVEEIARRITALPIEPGQYRDLQAGKPGTIYYLKSDPAARPDAGPSATLVRWTTAEKKEETLAEKLVSFELSADGAKMLLAYAPPPGPPPAPGAAGPKPVYAIAPADRPAKPGDPELKVNLAKLAVRVDPPAEWAQIYREIWRIERAYFYDPKYHGYDTVAAEQRLLPYLKGVQSRSDLNYVFQEMLTGFSVGHLRGFGGAIPLARRVPGGLLGADYTIRDGRYCIAKIYNGGSWSPEAVGPLARPGLGVRPGDCILGVNGMAVDATMDIQQPLEGMAGQAVVLRIQSAGAAQREVTVVPVASESQLRNLDWIDGNRRKVAQLSGGKLAYVYLPDTGAGGFTAFNRYFFAQTDKQGVVVDERFNAGGQTADYIVEVLGRTLASWWQPRYGAIDRSPSGAIFGPKVMIANEVSGSGGDYLPWLFRYRGIGSVVGKRTWGGLVGISDIPVLMDGGSVTAPSVGFFSPRGDWEVENRGVAPDIAVEQDPKLVADGHDPQLEAAVSVAMEALAKAPPPQPRRPQFPTYWKSPQ